ncbi:MAG: hypothetical protein LBG90_04765 [Spirochaetaceae bacterium]|jgi:hypothetical protein|nr:hypothetical protein [Spirochaetaceae bacterium]
MEKIQGGGMPSKEKALRGSALFAAITWAIIFTACPETPEEPKPAGSITITDIPGTIGTENNASYKIYVNMSDSQSHTDAPKAQGTALVNGNSSVTVQLYNPPSNWSTHPDPDINGSPWVGKSKYYSVTISEANAENFTAPITDSAKMNTLKKHIQAKAGLTFNDSKSTVSWDSLLNLIPEPQYIAIYESIILNDDDSSTTTSGNITITP